MVTMHDLMYQNPGISGRVAYSGSCRIYTVNRMLSGLGLPAGLDPEACDS